MARRRRAERGGLRARAMGQGLSSCPLGRRRRRAKRAAKASQERARAADRQARKTAATAEA
eukprot:5509588-Pyramimonas_sp.AAC.1